MVSEAKKKRAAAKKAKALPAKVYMSSNLSVFPKSIHKHIKNISKQISTILPK